MASRENLLTTHQMARFVAQGYLRFDAIVPDELNDQFVREAKANEIPEVPAGTALSAAYPEGSALFRLVRLPAVEGIIESLVGPGSTFDHHFLHLAMPPKVPGRPRPAQHTHQDSTIDPRFEHFDVQLMYFPHEVTEGMGGTRFVPGSHFRRVSEAAIARYQNVLGQQHFSCPAGTVLVVHHGLWHGGGSNATDQPRFMFKIRLNPTVKQCRLWNTDDLTPEMSEQRPIFFVKNQDLDHLHTVLLWGQPWYEDDVGRLELLDRVRLWRSLLGDENFDADYWLTRLENMPEQRADPSAE